MSNISDVYCFIDTKNQTNKCEDNNYKIVYDNNKIDIYKVNYNNSLDTNNNSLNTNKKLNNSQNNNTIQYAYINHDKDNNTTYTNK
jgi:hypothetical protein